VGVGWGGEAAVVKYVAVMVKSA